MNDKEKLNVKKEVVKINTGVKKVVTTKQTVEKSEDSKDSLKSMTEHMKENEEKTKMTIDFKTLLIYVLMIIFIAGLSVLMIKFCEKYDNEVNNTSEITTKGLTTTTETTTTVVYVTTSRIQNKATHTVFVPRR